MNTLKINVPDGFEIDKDKSSFEEIVFKPIKKELPKRWEDLGRIRGHWITQGSGISGSSSFDPTSDNRNLFSTEAQAKAAIALAQLSQLREVYRQGWVPDWNTNFQEKHSIIKMSGKLEESLIRRSAHFLSFPSEQIRDEFLKNFKDLIEEASPLLFG